MDLRNLSFKVNFDGSTGAVEKMDGATNKLKKTAENATKKLEGMSKSFTKLGKSLTTKVTAPIVGLATAGTKMALDLQQGIKKVSTLADSGILPVDKIEKEVRAISDASGIAQTEIAEAAYSALSAGVDSAKVMDFVRSGIDLTRAGFTDMETAIDATTTVLNAYGDDAFEISKIHDIFVQTQDKGKISVDELGKSIGRVIPTASSLGVNLDQLGASYAILTAKGQNAQLATTNLNAMLGEMGSTGSEVDKAIREMAGKSFAELTKEGKSVGEVLGMVDEYAKKNNLTLKDMFGSMNAGSAAVTLLSDGVEGFNKSLADMDGATGKTAQNAKTMEDGWLKIQKATTQVKNALIDAGAVIAPYIEMGAEKVSMLVEKFNSLDDTTKMNIMKFAGLAAAVGPVLLGVGKVIGIVGSAISIGTKLFFGIGKVIAIGSKLVGAVSTVVGVLGGPLTLAIGAAIAIGILLYKNWDKIKEKAGQLKDWVGEKWGEIKGATSETWDSIKNSITRTWDNVKTKTIEVWDGMLAKIDGAISKIKEGWQGLKDFVKNPIKGAVNIARNIKDKVTGGKVDGSHARGLAKVPWDNYVAQLHKGEEVLTADDPRNINNYKTITTTKSTQTTNSSPQIMYNPIFNIEMGAGTSEQDKTDLERRMKRVARESFDEFFYELKLQMGY